MEQGILLEAGTNELELLVFKLGATPFAINVAKVREIIQPCQTIGIPYAPNAVEGSFKIRDEILTLVNLGRHFDMAGEPVKTGAGMIIVVEMNDVRCGILVDKVERIYRLHWDQILAPSPYLASLNVPITGVVNIDSDVVLVADFETIIGQILGIQSVHLSASLDPGDHSNRGAHILLVDDSALVRKTLVQRLGQKGYEHLTVCNNGQHAWETIQSQQAEDVLCDLVLSDIEMPRMDGLHLTSKIKNDPQLKTIPVILFSSLITADNRKKGKSVGADAQVSKPNGEEMIQAIETWLNKARATNDASLAVKSTALCNDNFNEFNS
jgi:two-component system, chemotaxis family, chemotaxis protein CheV